MIEDDTCERCGGSLSGFPSAIVGDDMCGPCREKTDDEEVSEQ